MSDVVKATLHLEVRSRGKPGKPKLEQRVYTSEVPVDLDDGTGLLTLVRTVESFGGYVNHSFTRFHPESYDPETRTGVYRESFRGSDRIVDDLEAYGWTRRRDLEVKKEEV